MPEEMKQKVLSFQTRVEADQLGYKTLSDADARFCIEVTEHYRAHRLDSRTYSSAAAVRGQIVRHGVEKLQEAVRPCSSQSDVVC